MIRCLRSRSRAPAVKAGTPEQPTALVVLVLRNSNNNKNTFFITTTTRGVCPHARACATRTAEGPPTGHTVLTYLLTWCGFALVVGGLFTESARRGAALRPPPRPTPHRALQSGPGESAARRGVRRLGHADRHCVYEVKGAKATSAKEEPRCKDGTSAECNSTPCGSKPRSAGGPQHSLGRGRWQQQRRLRRHRGRTPKRTARGRPAIGERRA